MKKLIVISVLAAILLFLGSAVQAAVLTNESTDFDAIVSVDCANGGAGENVHLTGTLHVLITATANGNIVSGKSLYQPQGISGVGEVTGDTYRATGGTQTFFQGSLINGQYNTSYVNNFRIIGTGPGNNFLVHTITHLTVNANGDATATVDIDSIECR